MATNKKVLIDALTAAKAKVEDKNLLERLEYAIKSFGKDPKSVTSSVLHELDRDVSKYLDTLPATPVLEASLKPATGKKPRSLKPKNKVPAESSKEDEEDEEEEEEEEPEKKPATKRGKKSLKPKTEAKPTEGVIKTTPGITAKDSNRAMLFPKVINSAAFGKLTACPDKYKTLKEISDALDNDNKTLVFACFWDKSRLKEFSYKQVFDVPVPKEGFPLDMDTLQVIYTCKGIDALYALSTYTEAMFRFNEDDLEPVECTANDGTKFMMRYSAGLEFEVYEAEEEE